MNENPTDANEQFGLSKKYAAGNGVPKDLEKAFYWADKAAAQGHIGAQFQVGVDYFFGDGVPEDREKSDYWVIKAAEQGYANAQEFLGCNYFEAHDYEKGLYWYTKAAEQGNADSQFQVGWYYRSEIAGSAQDAEKAKYWLTKAAEQGHADAQRYLKEQAPKNKTDAGEKYRQLKAETDEKARKSREEANRKSRYIIKRAIPVILAVITMILGITIAGQSTEPMDSGDIAAIICVIVIPFIGLFLIIYLCDSGTWKRRIALGFALLLGMIPLIVSGNGYEEAPDVPYWIALSITYMAACILAMIFPKD